MNIETVNGKVLTQEEIEDRQLAQRRRQYIVAQINENKFQRIQTEIVYRVAKRLKDEQRMEAVQKDLVQIETALDELETILREHDAEFKE